MTCWNTHELPEVHTSECSWWFETESGRTITQCKWKVDMVMWPASTWSVRWHGYLIRTQRQLSPWATSFPCKSNHYFFASKCVSDITFFNHSDYLFCLDESLLLSKKEAESLSRQFQDHVTKVSPRCPERLGTPRPSPVPEEEQRQHSLRDVPVMGKYVRRLHRPLLIHYRFLAAWLLGLRSFGPEVPFDS